MSTTTSQRELLVKIGHTAPEGLPSYGGGVFHFSPDVDDDGQEFDDYGMEYNIHETPDGVFLAACHSAVGLVTWFRAASVDDVWSAIERGERAAVAR